MEMTGEQLVPASQADTWAALNDPEVLKECVPGCESITRVSDTEYQVLMTARIGPVSAKFKGKLVLTDLKPPESYALAFEGQGGVAGFGKGGAQVSLSAESPTTTRLAYSAKATVGGKLAQIGSRLVDAAAQKVAGEFFAAFNEKMAARHAPAGAHDGHAAADAHGDGDDHLPEPIPRDPRLPDLDTGTLIWFAATALVIVTVSLFVLL